jgi:biopolymer transport protein ExbD
MIDVTFLLLIFFLVTTTFERAEGLLTAQMPKDAGAPSVALPLSPIVIRLARTGPEHNDLAIRIDRFERVPTDFDDLAAILRAIHDEPGFDVETPVVIAASNDVPWDHIVGCWNAALRANCRRVAFAEP